MIVVVGLGLVLVLLLGFAVTHPSLAWLLMLMIGSGRGGGGWGGGGLGRGRRWWRLLGRRRPFRRRRRVGVMVMVRDDGIDVAASRLPSAPPSARPRASCGSRSRGSSWATTCGGRPSGPSQRLRMHRTKRRNGVLIFVAPLGRRFAIIADEGMHGGSTTSGTRSSTACSTGSAPAI